MGDLLYVQATLENGWKFELDFQYKIKWFDRDGFEVAPESQPWRQLVMAGRSQSNVQAVAPTPAPCAMKSGCVNKRPAPLNKEKVMVRVLSLAALAMALLLTGCASKVDYGDAQARETVTTDFGSTDLQMIAAKMVDDMMVFPPIVDMTRERRPVLFVDRVKNKTSEHIDTESITDTIQTKLINSGKFRFVDMSVVNRVREQLEYQQDSGMVDQATAAQMGRQIGAEFMLYGNLSSIVKRDDSTKDVYYKFTLKLLNIQSGIIEWSGEKEIRKTRKRSLFGL